MFPQVDGFQQRLSVGQIDVSWQLSTWQAVDADIKIPLRRHCDVPVRCPGVVAILATEHSDIFKTTDPQALQNSYGLIHCIHKLTPTAQLDSQYAPSHGVTARTCSADQ